MPTIKLKDITCNVPDESDKDEMYLKFKGEKVWPLGSKYFRIDFDEKVEVDLELEVEEGWVEIELWDYDFVSRNDHLGSFKMKIDKSPGKYSASMHINEKETKKVSYFLTWETL